MDCKPWPVLASIALVLLLAAAALWWRPRSLFPSTVYSLPSTPSFHPSRRRF